MTRPGCDQPPAVMKHLALCLVLALAAATGCSKTNDLPVLEDDATAMVKFYTPRLDGLEARLHDVLAQSGRVPKNLPGSDDATRALVDARDKLVELRTLGKNIERQAPEIEKNAKLSAYEKTAALEKLVEDEEHRYIEGTQFVHENLMQVESWLTNAIRSTQAAQGGSAGSGSAGSSAPSAADIPATAVP
jgi:hypothetical protein